MERRLRRRKFLDEDSQLQLLRMSDNDIGETHTHRRSSGSAWSSYALELVCGEKFFRLSHIVRLIGSDEFSDAHMSIFDTRNTRFGTNFRIPQHTVSSSVSANCCSNLILIMPFVQGRDKANSFCICGSIC